MEMAESESENSDDSIEEMINRQVEETAGVIVSAQEICHFSPRDLRDSNLKFVNRSSAKMQSVHSVSSPQL